jgi:hypothetical protein
MRLDAERLTLLDGDVATRLISQWTQAQPALLRKYWHPLEPVARLRCLWTLLTSILVHGCPGARALSEGSPSNWAAEGGPAVRT